MFFSDRAKVRCNQKTNSERLIIIISSIIVICVSILLCSSQACSFKTTTINDAKIVGGNSTDSRQFPATVGLMIKNPGPEPNYLTCTMTKIAERIFLTAAHCFFELGEQDGTKEVREAVENGAEIAIHFGWNYLDVPLIPGNSYS